MARGKKRVAQALITPDPVHGNRQLTKLINRVMMSGKKSIAQTQVYNALKLASEKTKKTPVGVFEESIAQITPKMEVRTRRVGGASYQVPMPVRGARGFSLAIRWLVNEAKKRPNKEFHTFGEKLAAEMMDSLKNEGGAIQKKLTMHKQAEANKAFSHFRW